MWFMRRNRPTDRWYVLILAALTHTFVVAMPVMCMPVLFKEISQDLGLSLVQVGAVWGVGSLSGMFTGLVGGSLGDRFGIKRTLSTACLLAGLTGALRGLSGDFVTLTATAFLFGLLPPAVPPNIHKTCGIWFPGRRLGLANGVVSAGMALGFMAGSMMSATVLSPWLGGWRNVLFLYGAISVVISMLWLLTGSEIAPKGDEHTASLGQALSHVVGLRNVWFLGLVLLGIGGCLQGVLGYLPLHLREIGWAGASADGALAAFHGISLVFTIPLAFLSDRLGSRKPILVAATSMTIVGVGLLSIAEGTLVWASVALAGIVRDGFMAIFMTMVMETKGVGAQHAGTAMGMVMVFYRLGGLLSPPLGNSLAAINLGLPFIFWAALAAVALFGFYFVKNGTRESDVLNKI
jgi:MFS family permease